MQFFSICLKLPLKQELGGKHKAPNWSIRLLAAASFRSSPETDNNIYTIEVQSYKKQFLLFKDARLVVATKSLTIIEL